MNCEKRFEELYHKAPEGISFCPYRICPIGAHSDHNLGKVTGLAIDKGIHIAFKPKENGVVELCSLQFDKRAQWHIMQVPARKENDWADYLRGATLQLGRRYPLRRGMSGVIEGTLPIGGLSSSAAVTLAFLGALCRVNGLHPSAHELIQMAVAVENDYVGVNSGKLDQSCEILARKDHLLYLDTQNDQYELIPTHPAMPAYDIMIFFSGVERTLTGSAFNMRVDEARAAAYALKAFAGMPYGKFGETSLREVPREVFERYKGQLPENWRLRAEHWYTEYQRVEEGAEAWRRGDLQTFGRLSFESGRSSIENWQTGSPELKTLYDLMTQAEGIYGGRFSGAGFKGCCMALTDPAHTEAIGRSIGEAYLKKFPQLEGKFSIHVCHSADGVIV